MGYILSLDDFVYGKKFGPLVDLADIIKVDFIQTTGKKRNAFVRDFAPRDIKLLAEKVETAEKFKQAEAMGYTCFQGYFFSKPVIISRKDIPGLELNYL